MVKIECLIQRVEYEGLHVICFECGEVGHHLATCLKLQSKAVNTQEMESEGEKIVDLHMNVVTQTRKGDQGKYGP